MWLLALAFALGCVLIAAAVCVPTGRPRTAPLPSNAPEGAAR